MDDELTPEQKFAAEDPEIMVPRALLCGRLPEDIVADLVFLDWTPDAARSLVARVTEDLRRYNASPEARRQLIKEAQKQLIGGLLIALLGVGITAFSLLLALAAALPFFVLAIGCFFGGLMLAARGWTRWRLYRK